MRIPPSAIVMTLVLAVPFGLAIRDSVKGNDQATAEAKAKQAALDLEAKENGDRLAAEAEQYERTKQLEIKRTAELATLIGTEPATLGTAVGNQAVGAAPVDGLHDLLTRTGINLEPRIAGDGTVVEIWLTLLSQPAECATLRTVLTTAWGDHDGIWIDAAHHRRASFSDCAFEVVRTVNEAAWVQAALPKLLGKPFTQLEKTLGVPAEADAMGVKTWYLPGPPSGFDATELEVSAEDHTKIDRTSATVTVTDEQSVALITAISRKLGRQPVVDGATYSWGEHVTVTYSMHTFILVQQ